MLWKEQAPTCLWLKITVPKRSYASVFSAAFIVCYRQRTDSNSGSLILGGQIVYIIEFEGKLVISITKHNVFLTFPPFLFLHNSIISLLLIVYVPTTTTATTIFDLTETWKAITGISISTDNHIRVIWFVK